VQGKDHIDLTGRVAIVTGGTRGLGRHIAEALARAGAAVTVCGRTEPEELPGGIEFRAADIRDPEQAEALVDAVAAQHGRLDALVNNAGGSPQAPATASPRFFDSSAVARKASSDRREYTLMNAAPASASESTA